VRADVLARYGAQRPRVEVAWPAVDVERFASAAAGAAAAALRAARASRPGAPLIAFVGHDFELKGLARAIDALVRSDAFARGARLLVAGRGRRAAYVARARALGAEGSVRFLDAPADVAALLGASDGLLHPTRFDPCALATLEALAAGIPAVTTHANGAAPLVERGGGRVVGDEAGAESLAAALDSVLADPAARDRAREAGRLLGWDAHLDRVEPLLERGWAGARADARP
jgi:UDP-glucose:(heptosyl)LPS alpha-1,3-glucosyltransferase